MDINSLKNISFLKELDDAKLDKLQKYMSLTLEENKKINLTALDDEESFIVKNILDSLMLVESLKDDISEKSLIDIGSGAGLPGIPLAIYYPDTYFFLLEPTTKRANFLRKIVDELSLKNVTVINERAEIFARRSPKKFDYGTARAVANINILLELAIPLLKVGGTFIAYKGKNYENEASSIFSVFDKLKISEKLVVKTELPIANEERILIFFQKNDKTPNIYPRNYSLIKKKPL